MYTEYLQDHQPTRPDPERGNTHYFKGERSVVYLTSGEADIVGAADALTFVAVTSAVAATLLLRASGGGRPSE